MHAQAGCYANFINWPQCPAGRALGGLVTEVGWAGNARLTRR
jgi:hypothetical protein